MYYSAVPTLVIRADALCAVFLNGRLAGECSPVSHIALPVSSHGDYYVSAHPLEGGGSITRKLSFSDGAPDGGTASGASLCVWPGGVFELTLHTGAKWTGTETVEPNDALALALDFVRRVRVNDDAGAMRLLEGSLAESLDFRAIKEFFGEFYTERVPFADESGRTLGAVSGDDGGVSYARVFEFEYDDGRIANIKEV